MTNRKKLIIGLIIIFALILTTVGIFLSVKKKSPVASQNKISVDELTKPLGTTQINKPFEYTLQDPKGKDIVLKYTLTSAKLVKYITLANQPVNIQPDQAILIVELEIQNDSNYLIKSNSQDFVRLVGDGDKRYAPDFYNGVEDVAAISVKKDEIAFIVNKDQRNFKLQIGEIDKEKQDVDITL